VRLLVRLRSPRGSIIRGRMYARAKRAQGGDHRSKCQTDTLKDTAEAIANKTGVSPRTVKRDAKRYEFVEKLKQTKPEAAQAVLSGRKRLREVEREERKAEAKENAGTRTDLGAKLRSGSKIRTSKVLAQAAAQRGQPPLLAEASQWAGPNPDFDGDFHKCRAALPAVRLLLAPLIA
jgi:hypothetical protein